MALLALLTEKDPFLEGWLNRLGSRLKNPNWISGPFKGALKSYKAGKNLLWVIDVEPIYPRYVFNVILIFLLFCAATMQVIGWDRTATWTYVFTASGFLLLNMFWSSSFYEAVIKIQLRRLLKRKVFIKRADVEALRWLAHGKV
jgi:hypothetical protein